MSLYRGGLRGLYKKRMKRTILSSLCTSVRSTNTILLHVRCFHNQRFFSSVPPSSALRFGVAQILRVQPVNIAHLSQSERQSVQVYEKTDSIGTLAKSSLDQILRTLQNHHRSRIVFDNKDNNDNKDMLLVLPQQIYHKLMQQSSSSTLSMSSGPPSPIPNHRSLLSSSSSLTSTSSSTPNTLNPIIETASPSASIVPVFPSESSLPVTPLSQIAELLWSSSALSSTDTHHPSSSTSSSSSSSFPPPRLPGRSSILEASLTPYSASTITNPTDQTNTHTGNSSSSFTKDTPVKLSPRQEFLSACKEGNPNKIIGLLKSYQGLASNSTLTVDDIIHHDSENGATPLHYFVSSPVMTMVTDNVQQFTPPPSRSIAYSVPSPVMIHAAIKALVAAGADIDAPAANGSTPLHWAAGTGAEITVKSLLKVGASPLKQTYTWRRQIFGKNSGQTPLHWAAESNHGRIVDILTNANAQTIYIRDERGQLPKDIAYKELATDSMQILQRKEEETWICVRISLESEAHGMLGGSLSMLPRVPTLNQDTERSSLPNP